MRNNRFTVLLAGLLAVLCSDFAKAADVAGVFGQGRTHVVATAGTAHAFGDTYLVLGLGVSYYVIDGLNVGLSYEAWTGGDPGVSKLTPSAQYVFYRSERIKPYVGVFYRRTYVDGLPDIDSAGGKAGAYFRAGRNAYLGAAVVYESYVDCNNAVYRSCTSTTYPEVTFTLAF
jgi:hypothetical protein